MSSATDVEIDLGLDLLLVPPCEIRRPTKAPVTPPCEHEASWISQNACCGISVLSCGACKAAVQFWLAELALNNHGYVCLRCKTRDPLIEWRPL